MSTAAIIASVLGALALAMIVIDWRANARRMRPGEDLLWMIRRERREQDERFRITRPK